MIIGGAEDKVRKPHHPQALRRRSAAARTHASPSSRRPPRSDREVVDVYDALFTKFGAARGRRRTPRVREQAHDPALVKALDEATGIFMTGGNQLKLSVHRLRHARG